ncbi:MAG: hypothetical protein A2080_01415 [Ignavibacteria bacterium GWC2_36_12]|nr:MAG: hypothetical protein A2080_01415 [Ignavibacteria bacterium GWC2_36_12]
MFKNYFKIALRNFIKQKGYSLINVLGLSVGLAACILIALYIMQELSFDSFHEKGERIYRITSHLKTPTEKDDVTQTPWPVGSHIGLEFPEVEKAVRIYFSRGDLLKYNDKKFLEENLIYADSTFFQIFDFKILEGEKNTLLAAPFSIVLTKGSAEKYFGKENPIGQQIEIENKKLFTVTGIVDNPPVNSHFHFDFIGSYSSLTPEFFGWDPSLQWGAYFGNYTYVLIKENTSVKTLKEKTKNWLNDKQKSAPGNFDWIDFEPLKEIHLNTELHGEIEPSNSAENLIIISVIGIFILIIACINFINLSTSRASRRAREVGVRKTLGALRFHLMVQFSGEALIISLAALLLAIVLVEITLPAFSILIGVEISKSILSNFYLLGAVTAITVFIGLLSGFYPSIILSKYDPAQVVKGRQFVSHRTTGIIFRKVLVTFQFTIAIGLIIVTLVVNKQIQYSKNTYLGFNKDHIIDITLNDPKVVDKINAFTSELSTIPGVESQTVSFRAPIGRGNIGTNLMPNGPDAGGNFSIYMNFTDSNYIKHFGLDIIAGRDFISTTSDTLVEMIINEEVVKKLGFGNPEETIGRRYPIGINNITGEVVGVVKNFHIATMHSEILPFVFSNQRSFIRDLSIKITSQDISGTISKIKNKWEEFSQAFPFTFSFLDEQINSFYKREDRQQNIVITFSIMAVLIACLGLLGLASFAIEQRTKEIGIRKIFGASIKGITFMLSKDFLQLVIISGIIASPVAYYLMNGWLDDFAYKTAITFDLFAYAIIISLFIAIFTIGFHAIKAAITSPVKSLRYE